MPERFACAAGGLCHASELGAPTPEVSADVAEEASLPEDAVEDPADATPELDVGADVPPALDGAEDATPDPGAEDEGTSELPEEVGDDAEDAFIDAGDDATGAADAPEVSPPPACLTAPATCDDGEPCTADGCDEVAGCTHVPAGAIACGLTGQGICAAGACTEPWAVTIAAGRWHTCVLLSDQSVRCWGANQGGQLGTGAAGKDEPKPVPVLEVDDAVELAAGGDSACAVRIGGGVACWGSNSTGQLGLGTTGAAPEPTPKDAPLLQGLHGLAMGPSHACGVGVGGGVTCWGSNSEGQLGPLATLPGPNLVAGLSGAIAVTAGDAHSCAALGEGAAWCWGLNGAGQLGDGSVASGPQPVQVQELNDLVAVAGGVSHTLGVRKGGQVSRWGWDLYGPKPDEMWVAELPGLVGVARVAVGPVHGCAIAGAQVLCWGANTAGQLGVGAIGPDAVSPDAIAVPGVTGASRIAVGNEHTCVVVAGGHVTCWGSNGHGQLGSPGAPGGNSPVSP